MRFEQFIIRERVQANIRFALALALWALLALFCILLITAYTIRLDIAFLEANKMMRDDSLRAAIFYKSFEFETWMILAFPSGILANGAIAALFGRSQERYFLRFREAFEKFEETWKTPNLNGLGPLETTTQSFMMLAAERVRSGESPEYLALRDETLLTWKIQPKIYWRDQINFALVSGFLALYFSSLCMVLFWTANDNMLNLSQTLLRVSGGEAPQFFNTQLGMAETLGWAVVLGITFGSILSSIRFTDKTANASYAVGRQLSRFLWGDSNQRINLRMGDPGREHMERVNKVLAKLEETMKAKKSAV